MVVVSLLHHVSQKQVSYIKRPRCSYSMFGNVSSDQFPEDQRVCVLLKEKTENLPSHWRYHLSSPSNKTDRKRVFGFEFMEPAGLNKALRESALLSGVTTRFRSKTILIAHPQADWGCTRLVGLVHFFVSEARIADFQPEMAAKDRSWPTLAKPTLANFSVLEF